MVKVNSKWGAVLAATCVAAAFAIGVSSASAIPRKCSVIQGAGSSLQKIIQQEVWGPTHWETKKGEEECESITEVKYNPTSSQKGEEQWGYESEVLGNEEPFPVFVGTDLAPSSIQIARMTEAAGVEVNSTDVMAVPVAQSAIAVMISLPVGCKQITGGPEVKHTALREEWEKGAEEASAFLRDKLEGTCAGKLKLKTFSLNSGTTAAFKRYFDTLSKEAAPWKELTETPLKSEEPTWPAELEASGNLEKCCSKGGELAKVVLETPGSIGYADLIDARDAGFAAYPNSWFEHEVGSKKFWSAIVWVENGSGPAPPEAEGGANCGGAIYSNQGKVLLPHVEPGADWSEVKQKNVAEYGYSICTLTFDLVWREYETKSLEEKYGTKSVTEEKRNTVLNYLKWDVSGAGGGGQTVKALKERHYHALPKEIREKAESGVKAANIK